MLVEAAEYLSPMFDPGVWWLLIDLLALSRTCWALRRVTRPAVTTRAKKLQDVTETVESDSEAMVYYMPGGTCVARRVNRVDRWFAQNLSTAPRDVPVVESLENPCSCGCGNDVLYLCLENPSLVYCGRLPRGGFQEACASLRAATDVAFNPLLTGPDRQVILHTSRREIANVCRGTDLGPLAISKARSREVASRHGGLGFDDILPQDRFFGCTVYDGVALVFELNLCTVPPDVSSDNETLSSGEDGDVQVVVYNFFMNQR